MPTNSLIQLFDNDLYIFNSKLANRSTMGIVYHVIDYYTHKHYAIKQSIDHFDSDFKCNVLKNEYDILLKMKSKQHDNIINNVTNNALFPLAHNYCKQNNVCLLQMDFIPKTENQSVYNIFKAIYKHKSQISLQFIIRNFMNCFINVKDTLSILHSFNLYTNDLHPWNILYKYDQAMKCYLIDFGSMFMLRKKQMSSTVGKRLYFKTGIQRLSSYLLYKLFTPEKRYQENIDALNKYASMNDEYALGCIIVGYFVQTLNQFKHIEHFKHNFVTIQNLMNMLNKIKELSKNVPHNEYQLYDRNNNVKIFEKIWYTYALMADNIKNILKYQNINMDEPSNQQFYYILQIICKNYEWAVRQNRILPNSSDIYIKKIRAPNEKHNNYDGVISNEMKVFEIGVAKTSTTSLGIALEILGYKTAHFNKTLKSQWKNTKNINNILLASQYFDAFEDSPWHAIDFRIWYYKYPNAKFILLERDDESWLKSSELWFSPKYNINNVSGKLDDLWITNRTKKRNKLLKYKHSKYKDAIQFFTNNNESDKLLIMNISEGLSWKPLCKFLNKSIPNIPYPTSHNSSQLMHQNMIKVTPISDRNHGNKLYRFQEFEWLNITNQTVNIECNKVVCDHNCLKASKRCCSGLTDNKYLIGSYNNNVNYNSTRDNDQTICDLLLIMSNKSILSIGDSIQRNIHLSFVRDIFEKSKYICEIGYITNIKIDSFEKTAEKLLIAEGPSFLKSQIYDFSFDYYDSFDHSKKHKFKWSHKTIYRIIASHVFNDKFNQKYKFNYNEKSINYSKLNLTNLQYTNAISLHYFMYLIETGEYDSVLINVGMHYKIAEGESNHYKYILNFVANILQNDMLMNTNKIHIWRMTTPSHFHGSWRERFNYTTCVTTGTAKHQSNTNSYEDEIFHNSNYSMPIIDYNNVLLSRGDLHLDKERDCTHWCASNKLWKPFWKLLTQIYKDQSW